MTGKLTLALGFAAGYVLGSKAGRERYEQIVGASRRLWSNQTVQSTAGVLQAQASDLVGKAKDSDLVMKAKQKVSMGGGETTSSPPTPTPLTTELDPTPVTTELYEPTPATTELYEPTTRSSYTSDRPNGLAP